MRILYFNNMERQEQEKQSKLSPVQYFQSILGLIVGIVGTSVVLFSGWDSIPSWGRNTILVLVTCVTLIYIIVPTQRWARKRIGLIRERRKQQLNLRDLALLLQKARFLYDPHLTCSLRNYVDSICNVLVQHQAPHSTVRRLAERLHILGDWHWSLLTFANSGFSHKTPFASIVRDITMLYRDTADVVRELATMKIPEDCTLGVYNDQERMTKEKYNQHIERVEQLLEKSAKVNPELHTWPFHRF